MERHTLVAWSGTIIDCFPPENRLPTLLRFATEAGITPEEWIERNRKTPAAVSFASPPPEPVASQPAPTEDQWPALVRRIARFRNETDNGVGDTLERVFARFGGSQFKWAMKHLGINCGCEDRQAAFNSWYPYAKQ